MAPKRKPAIENRPKIGSQWSDELIGKVAKYLAGAAKKSKGARGVSLAPDPKREQARRIVDKAYKKAGVPRNSLRGGPEGADKAVALGRKVEGQLARTRVARNRKYGPRPR